MTPSASKTAVKHFNLAVPADLLDEVQKLADARHTTTVEMFRRFIKLGLLAARLEETSGAALIIREGDREREIVLL